MEQTTEQKKETNYFKLPAVYSVLLCLEGDEGAKSIHSIAVKTGITYSHCYKVVKFLHQKQFVSLEFIGRSNITKLTKKGNELVEKINELRNAID